MAILVGSTTKQECLSQNLRCVRTDDDGIIQVVTPPSKWLDVFVQDQTTPVVNLYMYQIAATPVLTAPASANNTVLNVDTNAGVVVGDAITILEDSHFFQSIVKSSTAPPGATITIQSPLDEDIIIASTIEVGPWNMNVDGSGATQEFSVKPPPNVAFDIYTITLSMTDNVVMDSGKFGGLPQLTNGIVIRQENTNNKNVALIVNNIGFKEQGCTTEYDDKAPAGVYGVTHQACVHGRSGVALRLNGSTNDKIKIMIQDDLRGLITMNCTIIGHVVIP